MHKIPLWVIKILACCIANTLMAQEAENMLEFKRISDLDAISDNNVQWIHQLSDGRMAVQTKSSLNIYDANGVTFYPRDEEFTTMLPHHNRNYTINDDNQNRVWIKEWNKLWCVDLIKGSHINDPMAMLHPNSVDVYFDAERNTITLTPDSLMLKDQSLPLPVSSSKVGEVVSNYADKIIFDMDGGAYLWIDNQWTHYPNPDVPKDQDWWYYRTFDDGECRYYRMLSELNYSRYLGIIDCQLFAFYTVEKWIGIWLNGCGW